MSRWSQIIGLPKDESSLLIGITATWLNLGTLFISEASLGLRAIDNNVLRPAAILSEGRIPFRDSERSVFVYARRVSGADLREYLSCGPSRTADLKHRTARSTAECDGGVYLHSRKYAWDNCDARRAASRRATPRRPPWESNGHSSCQLYNANFT